MKIEMMPTISIGDLTEAVNIQYGWELTKSDLLDILFVEPYTNDCYLGYWFDDFLDGDEYHTENCVIAYLKDIMPGYKKILIDVSW